MKPRSGRIVIDAQPESAALVLRVSGEVDMHTSPQMRQALQDALAARPARLILDLTEVGYMDSSGVGTIVEAKRHADRQGGRVVLANLQARVRSVLEITQLDRFFVIAASLEAAREA